MDWWESFCQTCGWRIVLTMREYETLEQVRSRPVAKVDEYGNELVWRHSSEPWDHVPEPGGEPNAQMAEILAGRRLSARR